MDEKDSRQLNLLHDRYELGEVLGTGAFGTVYLAYDRNLEKQTAVKECLLNGNTAENFREEASVLFGHFDVPGLVSVLDCFTEGGAGYLVMEYLEGGTLKAYLEKQHTMPAGEAAAAMQPVMEALTYLHSRGLLHGDVSPDNLMFDRTGCLKLIDFGTVRQKENAGVHFLKESYAPPEFYVDRSVSGPWSDLYSVCAVLYEMITGRKVMPAEARMQNDLLRKMNTYLPVDPQTDDAILRGLSLDVQKRFFSLGSLMALLQIRSEYVLRLTDAVRSRWGMRWLEITADAKRNTFEKKKSSLNLRKIKRTALLLFAAAAVLTAVFGGRKLYLEANPAVRLAGEIAADQKAAEENPIAELTKTSDGYERIHDIILAEGTPEKNSTNRYSLSEATFRKLKTQGTATAFVLRKDTAEDLVLTNMQIEKARGFREKQEAGSFGAYVGNGRLGQIVLEGADRYEYSLPDGESLTLIAAPGSSRVESVDYCASKERAESFLKEIVPVICPEAVLTDKEIDALFSEEEAVKNHDLQVLLNAKAKLGIRTDTLGCTVTLEAV